MTAADYLTADQLRQLGIDPADLPGVVELTALDGSPCFAAADLGLDPAEGE